MIFGRTSRVAVTAGCMAMLGLRGAVQAQQVGTYEGIAQPGDQPIQVDVAFDPAFGQLYVAGVRLPFYAIICGNDGGYIQPWSVDASGILAWVDGRRATNTVYGAFSRLQGRWDFARAGQISGTVQVAAAQFAGLDGVPKKSPQYCAGPKVSFVVDFQAAAQPWRAKGPGNVVIRIQADGSSEEWIVRGGAHQRVDEARPESR